MNTFRLLPFLFFISVSTSAFGAFVTPKMGGGQQSADMVMPNVKFDGTNLTVTGVVDMMGMPIAETPVLRPLTPPDEFNPAAPHAVLTGKAYNLQYGWNLDGESEFLPSGGNIWIESIASSPGLQAYEHGTYSPIFGTAGSSDAWLWDGIMAHNAYAVPTSTGTWTASYRLYIGDINGVALPGFGETSITLNWTSVPEPTAAAAIAIGSLVLGRRRR